MITKLTAAIYVYDSMSFLVILAYNNNAICNNIVILNVQALRFKMHYKNRINS